MGGPKKKPEYDSEKIMEQFTNCIAESYMSGAGDGSANSLRQVAEQFSITLMKARKILITAGVYHTELSDQVISLKENGNSIFEIMQETGLSRSSVHSYLPYTKVIYNADELSLYAERCRLYRERKQAVEKLHCCIGKSYELLENHLWEMLKLFSGYSFTTVKGLKFHYTVNGNEILIDRKKKSITRSGVHLQEDSGILNTVEAKKRERNCFSSMEKKQEPLYMSIVLRILWDIPDQNIIVPFLLFVGRLQMMKNLL